MEVTGATAASRQGLLTERSWEDLLDFLDPARPGKRGAGRDAEAEGRYLEIVRKLVCFFAGRGCRDGEDLAVECVLRVAGKCHDVDASAYADRTGYFFGVARNVLHESWRFELRESTKRDRLKTELKRLGISDPRASSRREQVHRSLERCLKELSPRARRLILSYYAEAGAAKIESHRKLADEVDKSLNALRIEIHRIRATLRACLLHRLGPDAALPGP